MNMKLMGYIVIKFSGQLKQILCQNTETKIKPTKKTNFVQSRRLSETNSCGHFCKKMFICDEHLAKRMNFVRNELSRRGTETGK